MVLIECITTFAAHTDMSAFGHIYITVFIPTHDTPIIDTDNFPLVNRYIINFSTYGAHYCFRNLTMPYATTNHHRPSASLWTIYVRPMYGYLYWRMYWRMYWYLYWCLYWCWCVYMYGYLCRYVNWYLCHRCSSDHM